MDIKNEIVNAFDDYDYCLACSEAKDMREVIIQALAVRIRRQEQDEFKEYKARTGIVDCSMRAEYGPRPIFHKHEEYLKNANLYPVKHKFADELSLEPKRRKR